MECLEDIAMSLVQCGEHEQTLVLIAAADHERRDSCLPPPYRQTSFDPQIEAMKMVLSKEQPESAWAEGHSLPISEATTKTGIHARTCPLHLPPVARTKYPYNRPL